MANAALKAAWQLFSHNANYLLTVAFIVGVPATIGYQFLQGIYSELGATLIYMAPAFFVSALQTGAFSHSLDTAWRGEQRPYSDLYGAGLTTWIPMLACFALMYLATILGFVLFIVPGVIIMLKLSFAPYSVALEGASAAKAIASSWRRTKGLTGTMFLATLAVVIPLGLALGVIAGTIVITNPGMFEDPRATYILGIINLLPVIASQCVFFAFYQYALRREYEQASPSRDPLPLQPVGVAE